VGESLAFRIYDYGLSNNTHSVTLLHTCSIMGNQTAWLIHWQIHTSLHTKTPSMGQLYLSEAHTAHNTGSYNKINKF